MINDFIIVVKILRGDHCKEMGYLPCTCKHSQKGKLTNSFIQVD